MQILDATALAGLLIPCVAAAAVAQGGALGAGQQGAGKQGAGKQDVTRPRTLDGDGSPAGARPAPGVPPRDVGVPPDRGPVLRAPTGHRGRVRPEFDVGSDVAVRPRRLGPGERGELFLILALRGDLVVLAGAKVQVDVAPHAHPLALGAAMVDPPRLGRLDNRFRGQPVHDETLILRLPVQVAADAPHGRYAIQATVRCALHDGTGGSRGVLEKAVAGVVHVGTPLPRPAVPRPAAQRAVPRLAPADPADPADPAMVKGAPPDQPSAPDRGAGGTLAPGPEPSLPGVTGVRGREPATPEPVPVDPGTQGATGLPCWCWLLLGGLTAAAGQVLLVFFRRRAA